MDRYVAFLRGINVGKKNRINMKELSAALADAGLSDVCTYIQSGNIIFSSELGEAECSALIFETILDCFGISVAAVLRTCREVHDLIENDPYPPNEIEAAQSANAEGESRYVCLYANNPAEAVAEKIQVHRTGCGSVCSHRTGCVLLLSKSIRHSKLAALYKKRNYRLPYEIWKQ
jgi:uncharacterized protein (DUF1697 family)